MLFEHRLGLHNPTPRFMNGTKALLSSFIVLSKMIRACFLPSALPCFWDIIGHFTVSRLGGLARSQIGAHRRAPVQQAGWGRVTCHLSKAGQMMSSDVRASRSRLVRDVTGEWAKSKDMHACVLTHAT